MHYNDYNAIQCATPHIKWMCNSIITVTMEYNDTNALQWFKWYTMKIQPMKWMCNEVQWILCSTMITMAHNDNNGIQYPPSCNECAMEYNDYHVVQW